MSFAKALKTWLLRWEVIVGVTVVVGVAWLAMRFFLYEPFRIPSDSMYPTLPSGSYVIVSKLGYGNYGFGSFRPLRTEATAPIQRGDIVVFVLPQDPDILYIQRVIGLPGDHVEYRERRLSINGAEAQLVSGTSDARYQYATETIDGRDVSLAFVSDRYSRDASVDVPDDHLFLMGDSRDNAKDSRYIGFVPRANVIGLLVKIFPGPKN